MRWQAGLGLLAVLIVAAGTGSAATEEQPVRIVAFTEYAPAVPLDEALDNLQCTLGFKPLARYHKAGLRGFAARLSDLQLRRLEWSALTRPPLVERGNFLLTVAIKDPDAAERRIEELAREIGFTLDVRFNRGSFRGWGATLDWDQLRRLDSEADVSSVTPNPFSYVVWFDHLKGDAAVQRTAELGQKYGFKAAFVLPGYPGAGFGASLTNAQLAGLSEEPDLDSYVIGDGGDGGAGFVAPPHVGCLHASPKVRRNLLRAFKRAHPGVRARGPVGRVLYARLARQERELGPVVVTGQALATFRVRSRSRVTELFQLGPRPWGWADNGRVGRRLCTDRLDSVVLESWLFRPVGPYCYARN